MTDENLYKVHSLTKGYNNYLYIVVFFCVSLFIVNVVFFPADTFQLKKILFVVLLLLCFDKNGIRLKGFDEKCFFFLGGVLISYLIIKSVLLTGSFIENFLVGFSGYLVLLYFPIKKYRFDFEKILMNILMSLAIFICIMAFLDYIGIIPLEQNFLLNWFKSSENAILGKTYKSALGVIYFFKTTPMLTLCIAYYLGKNKLLHAIFALVAMILSGTRANIIMGIITFAICVLYGQNDSKKRMGILFIEIVIIFIVLRFTTLIDFTKNVFEIKAGSDEVRNLHLESLFSFWKSNPSSFFIGSGFSSEFYSLGFRSMTSNMELSYWNLLRRVGIIPFIMMMYMYFYPVIKLIRCNFPIVVGYLSYLVIAYTNPLLYSSTGMTVLLYLCWLVFVKNSSKEVEFISIRFIYK